ncbi:MAG TPA: hypothetical protein PKV46_06440 [Candidatus Marinimicrobia bacterium]|jgi:hypothetical protein|nr:hypothetical protein [Candidatus Neomarinimicrobiota bacterium]HQQ85537.1 hypothetical protein [Candidatus Neomarinimicrobiota bacterium]
MNTNFISKEEKIKILIDIINSSEFQNAQKFQELLRYLVDASISGKIIKESTIAIEFFQKDKSFDPSIDSTVRTSISTLRKKLEHYYLTTGKTNSTKLTIPKGHYNIVFVDSNYSKPKNNLKKKFYLYSLIFVLCLIILITLITNLIPRKNTQIIPYRDPIWNDIFSNSMKTLIVLGDYYFFYLPFENGRHSYIRDVEINSEEDLNDFLKNNPQYSTRISKTYHTYLDESLPICISKILPSFNHYKLQYELKMSSELQLDDLQKYNIIYIGSYKCLYLLSTITRNLHFQYFQKPGSSTLIYHQQSDSVDYQYTWLINPVTNARNDYAIVVKASGQNNNIFMMFLSEHDFGNLGTVKYFTDPIKLKELYLKIRSNLFEALFEVTGVKRTDFSIELLHYNPLHSEYKIKIQ